MTTGFGYRELTDAERDQFLKDHVHGILSFSDGAAYAIPLGYFYRKGDLLLGLTKPGRKIDCVQKSPKVCFTICRPRWQTPDLKGSCITAVVEGELEELTDRSYYGLKPLPEAIASRVITFRIKVDKMSARECTIKPCELFARPWVDAKTYAHWVHEPEKST